MIRDPQALQVFDYILPTNLTVVRFDLDALGLTVKDVLEGTESPESRLHRRLSLGRPRALTRRLEQVWATYGLTGAAFIYPFALSALPFATWFTSFPGKTHRRAEDPLLVLNVTRAIPSVAIECRARPRLLVNPDFVQTYCGRDEHLFLLVMHELWHVVLGHTRLFTRTTPAHNVAFDAIINASLSRQFPGPDHRAVLVHNCMPRYAPLVCKCGRPRAHLGTLPVRPSHPSAGRKT